MRKDNPPIPVGIETGGLESLQRFETHWKVQKIRKFFPDVPRRFRRRCFNKSQAGKTAKDKLFHLPTRTDTVFPKRPCFDCLSKQGHFWRYWIFYQEGAPVVAATV